MDQPKIAAVVGCTGSGKSHLAVKLAKQFGGEVVSCDSMQIYRRMDIGTGKVTEEEKEGIAHHLLDIVEPWEPFSCADYVKRAQEVVRNILSRGKVPIFCGGTGLYLDAFLRGADFAQTEVDTDYRRELEELAENEGNEALHRLLIEVDPKSAEQIHPNNVKRVIRALEIYKTSGKTKSQVDRESQIGEKRYDALVLMPFFSREILYHRIDARIDDMLAKGLWDEVESLEREGVFDKSATAAQAIGYKELLAALHGEETREEAVEKMRLATKHYAKRQLTWFSHKDYVKTVEATDENGEINFENIVNISRKFFIDFGFYDTIK